MKYVFRSVVALCVAAMTLYVYNQNHNTEDFISAFIIGLALVSAP